MNPFGALSEDDTCPRSPTDKPSGTDPKPCRMPPFDSPSNQTLRSFLRNTPRVPKVKPKDSLEKCLTYRKPPSTSPSAGPNTIFPGCHASAPRVPELTPRPYPVDSPAILRVFSERDKCPRVHLWENPPGSPECAAYPSAE